MFSSCSRPAKPVTSAMKGANPSRSGVPRGVTYNSTKFSSTEDSAPLEGGGWSRGWFTSDRRGDPEEGWGWFKLSNFWTKGDELAARTEAANEHQAAVAAVTEAAKTGKSMLTVVGDRVYNFGISVYGSFFGIDNRDTKNAEMNATLARAGANSHDLAAAAAGAPRGAARDECAARVRNTTFAVQSAAAAARHSAASTRYVTRSNAASDKE